MLRTSTQSHLSRHGLALAAPLFASALWLLAPASTALAANPPARRGGVIIDRGNVHIVVGARIGDRRNDRRDNDRCDGDRFERRSGRDDDLLYRGNSHFGSDRYYGLDSQAWCDLADGRFLRAKLDFLNQIECRPYEPVPRIGYAIASGRLDHDREAERSMRKAVDLDVNALDAIRVDSDLKREIRCLIDQYQSDLRCNHCDSDASFMIASLQSILGNYDEALCSIKDARRYGDYSSSARTLQCFIESKIECECHDNRRDHDASRGRDEGRERGRGRY